MFLEERRKLNRLSRRVSISNGTKKRLLSTRLPGKSSSKGQKLLNVNGTHPSSFNASRHLDFPVEFFKSCAEVSAFSSFSGDGVSVLQKYLHQITSILVQNTVRNMEQSRRGTPHISDIDSAALAMGLDIPHDAASGEFIPIRTNGRKAAPGVGERMIFIRKDKEVDIKTLLRRQPAPVIYDISLAVHWLAIDGVQPASPQNPPPEFLRRMMMLSGTQTLKAVSADLSSGGKMEDLQQTLVDLKMDKNKVRDGVSSHPRVMQALYVERRPQEVSQELMLYFRELTEACVGANEIRRRDALENATLDTGLQPLVPYLVTFIAEGIRLNAINSNLAILIYLMRLTKALVDNPNISLNAYLHILVPGVITCSLCRQVCAKPITDNHWALRDFAARQLVAICNKYNTSCNGLYSRITRELYCVLSTWIEGKSASTLEPFSSVATTTDNTDQSSVDPTRKDTTSVSRVSLGMAVDSFNTLYGTLTCINEFGDNCIRMLVFPRLPMLCKRLTRMTTASTSNASQSAVPPPNSAEMVMVMDQEGFQQTFNSPSATTQLSNAEIRSLDSLKKLMNVRFVAPLAEWRTRQNLPVTLEAYEADYGVMASCLFASATQSESQRPHATPAGALIVTKPQPPLIGSR